MISLRLLLLISLLSFHSYGQSKCDCFNRLYNLAIYTTDKNKYVVIMKDALSFLQPDQRGEYYPYIAKAYSTLQQYDSAKKYYRKAVECGYGIADIEQDIYIRMDTVKLKEIDLANRKKIDFVLYDKFVAHLAIDQSIRNESLFPLSVFTDTILPVAQRDFASAIYSRVDSGTYVFFMWVLDNYGMPNASKLGFDPAGIGAFILHVTAEYNERSDKLLTKLEELNRSCNFPELSNILFYRDRRRLYNTGKSYCGLIGTNRFFTIEDISKADSIRFRYNHVRIKEEAGRSNMELPKEYKPLPYPENYFCPKKYQVD